MFVLAVLPAEGMERRLKDGGTESAGAGMGENLGEEYFSQTGNLSEGWKECYLVRNLNPLLFAA